MSPICYSDSGPTRWGGDPPLFCQARPQAGWVSSLETPYLGPMEGVTLPVPTPGGSARAPTSCQGARNLCPGPRSAGPESDSQCVWGGLLSTSCHTCSFSARSLPPPPRCSAMSLILFPPGPPHPAGTIPLGPLGWGSLQCHGAHRDKRMDAFQKP